MIVSFGKYRHSSVKEIVERDYQYSQWLITQPWFTIKHKELHLDDPKMQALISRK